LLLLARGEVGGEGHADEEDEAEHHSLAEALGAGGLGQGGGGGHTGHTIREAVRVATSVSRQRDGVSRLRDGHIAASAAVAVVMLHIIVLVTPLVALHIAGVAHGLVAAAEVSRSSSEVSEGAGAVSVGDIAACGVVAVRSGVDAADVEHALKEVSIAVGLGHVALEVALSESVAARIESRVSVERSKAEEGRVGASFGSRRDWCIRPLEFASVAGTDCAVILPVFLCANDRQTGQNEDESELEFHFVCWWRREMDG